MLSYQHGYHAGNFADVIKHLSLTRLIAYLKLKDKPLFYLETHAGAGSYDLHDSQALKTGEARQGIELIWTHRAHLPTVFALYLQQIEHLNQDEVLRYYPGSPALAIGLMRSCDKLVLSELHPREFERLKQLPKHGLDVRYCHNDGLDNLKKILPPTLRRGLIFIDPSYELKSEYEYIAAAVKIACSRFATGVYCIWYPILDRKLHSILLRALGDIKIFNNLRIEFYYKNIQNIGMNGCGLWIINQPYTLKAELNIALDALVKIFNPGISSYLLD